MKQRGECNIMREGHYFLLSLSHHILQCAYLMSCVSSHPAYIILDHGIK